MAGVVQMSEAASIAIHATLWLAKQPAKYARSAEVCRLFGFSEAHFAKVMQALSRAGVVESVRGPHGGTRLARPPAEITLLEVYEALDGPFAETRCLLHPKICTSRCCPLGQEIGRLNKGMRQTLAGATLEAMAQSTDWSGLAGMTGPGGKFLSPIQTPTTTRKKKGE